METYKRPDRLLLALLLLLSTSLTSASEQRPNVIVIVADDLGWNDVGFHGGDIDTPSLDRLAAEGMELNRFYTTPICSPNTRRADDRSRSHAPGRCLWRHSPLGHQRYSP